MPQAGNLALPIPTTVTPRKRPSASNPQTPVTGTAIEPHCAEVYVYSSQLAVSVGLIILVTLCNRADHIYFPPFISLAWPASANFSFRSTFFRQLAKLT